MKFFSTVAKVTTIKLVLCTVAIEDLLLEDIDLKTSFPLWQSWRKY